MSKKGIHPNWIICNIFCNGKQILTTKSTQREIKVDIWAGNHPVYIKTLNKKTENKGRIENFINKYKF
jgi:ribosomal protein L31